MEQRQDVEHPVVGLDAEDLGDRLDVGVDVEVREDHALGLARAAAAEDDGRGVVDRDPPRGPGEPARAAGPGPGRRAPERDSSVARADRRGRRPRARSTSTPSGSSSLAFSRKARLVTTVRSPAWAAAELHRGPAGGEVQVDRRPGPTAPPPGSPAHAATLAGSRMPDVRLALPARPERAGQRDGAGQRLDARDARA